MAPARRALARLAAALLAAALLAAHASAAALLRRAGEAGPMRIMAVPTTTTTPPPPPPPPTTTTTAAATRAPTRAPTSARPPATPPEATLRGCLTWAETEAYLETLARAFPRWTVREEIGKSVEGRPVTALCVGQCRTEDPVPEALLNGMHHSRECVSMMALVKTLEAIFGALPSPADGADAEDAAAADDDAWARYILRSRRIWFVPVVNPDGFVYNEEALAAHPGVVRRAMQRKNRAPPPEGRFCGDAQVGVDLNRNYASCFFDDDKVDPIRRGASLNPCDEDYQGPAPFSEPETRAIRDLIERSNFTTALNVHSFGKFLLLPWSCKSKGMTAQESDFYLRLGRDFAGENHFVTGHSFKMVGYAVDGDAADWMYDAHGIYAMSPEVGPGDAWVDAKRSRDGFWPDAEIVNDLATANVDMALQAVLAAGSYLRLGSATLSVQASENAEDPQAVFDLVVENAGLWHSWSTVRAFARVEAAAGPNAWSLELRPLAAKYDSQQGKMRLPASALASGAPLTLGITDDRDCVLYEISLSSAEVARLSAQQIELGHLTGPKAFQRRFAASDTECVLGPQTTTLPPAPSTAPPAIDSWKESFLRTSDVMRAHADVALLGVAAITAVCLCALAVKTRRRAATRREYQSIQLPPLPVSMSNEGEDDVLLSPS